MTHRTYNDIGKELADGWGREDSGDFGNLIKTLPNDQKMVCLLTRIVHLLKNPPQNDSDLLDAHCRYMRWYFDDDTNMLNNIEKQLRRIIKLCHGNPLIRTSYEIHQFANESTIRRLARCYVDDAMSRNFNAFYDMQQHLRLLLRKLKQVKTIDHLLLFSGIGKMKLKKLKEQIKQQRRDK